MDGVKAIGWLALALTAVVAACAGGPVRRVPAPSPTPAGHVVVVPFENGGDRDVFPSVGDVVVVDGARIVAIVPSDSRVVRPEGTGGRLAVVRFGIAEVTVERNGERMKLWIRSHMETWQPYDVPFVNRSSQVAYPIVGQVVVVDGGGTVTITPPGVVRQEGTDTRFRVQRIGYATITIQRGRQRMVVYVQSS
jgi:hypothetical protein